MALAMLDKYASDADFREVLRLHGAAVIPPIVLRLAEPTTPVSEPVPMMAPTISLPSCAMPVMSVRGIT